MDFLIFVEFMFWTCFGCVTRIKNEVYACSSHYIKMLKTLFRKKGRSGLKSVSHSLSPENSFLSRFLFLLPPLSFIAHEFGPGLIDYKADCLLLARSDR